MGAAIPTLGYPSRQAAAIALRSQGLSNPVIADKLGIKTKNVADLFLAVERGPRHVDEDELDYVEQAVRSRLRRHARKRDISVDQLIDRIIYVVATEGLVDAVLDDREAGAA